MRYILLFIVLVMACGGAQASDAPQKPKKQTDSIKTTALFRPQNLLTIGKQSGQEVLLLSFYRNAGITPDFKKWSYMTDKAREAPEYDRPVAALNEQVRLQTIFTNLDPSGYLNVQAPVDVRQYSTSQEKLFIPTFSNRGGARGGSIVQKTYGDELAIVIPDLAQFAAIPMTYADAKFFYEAIKKVAKGDQMENAVIAELLVKPKQAIARKANRVGAGKQSIFVVDLAQLTLWRAGKEEADLMPLWSWKADWYQPDNDNPALLQLYK